MKIFSSIPDRTNFWIIPSFPDGSNHGLMSWRQSSFLVFASFDLLRVSPRLNLENGLVDGSYKQHRADSLLDLRAVFFETAVKGVLTRNSASLFSRPITTPDWGDLETSLMIISVLRAKALVCTGRPSESKKKMTENHIQSEPDDHHQER